MSEEHMADKYTVAKLYDSIILGLNKKHEAITQHKEFITTELDKYTEKICKLTGMSRQDIQNTEFYRLYSPDPITQLEINAVNHLFRTRIEKAEHHYNNYCRAIDKRVEHLNDILAEKGRERI